MRLVNNQQEVLREEVVERVRRAPRRPAGERPAVVFDARAMADLLQHLDVEPRSGVEPLGLQQLAALPHDLQPLFQLLLDGLDGGGDPLLRHHEVLGGVDEKLVLLDERLATDGVDDGKLLDRVPPQLDAEGIFLVARPDLHAITADAKCTALKAHVVPLILDVHQLHQHVVPVDGFPLSHRHHHRLVILGRAQAVNAGDAGHHDHVLAADERAGGGQAEPVDFLVDGGVLLDVDVPRRNIRLRLIIVVVADEVVDRVIGKELLELRVKLSRQRLVVRDDQRRLVELGDDVGDGVSLARPGRPQQALPRLAGANALGEGFDGLGLVAGGRERLMEGKGHGNL